MAKNPFLAPPGWAVLPANLSCFHPKAIKIPCPCRAYCKIRWNEDLPFSMRFFPPLVYPGTFPPQRQCKSSLWWVFIRTNALLLMTDLSLVPLYSYARTLFFCRKIAPHTHLIPFFHCDIPSFFDDKLTQNNILKSTCRGVLRVSFQSGPNG